MNRGPEAQIVTQAAAYIREQRNRLLGGARTLDPTRRATFEPYCNPLDLDRVRLIESPAVEIPVPAFYNFLRVAGVTDLPDFTHVTAITFDDLIVAREPLKPRILLHELVHVAQYRILGVDRFAQLYVRGFLRSRKYEDIPLERIAYELDARFWREQRFNVDSELLADAEFVLS